jgi:hypothetical protein
MRVAESGSASIWENRCHGSPSCEPGQYNK